MGKHREVPHFTVEAWLAGKVVCLGVGLLESRGLILKKGTIANSTIIAAPSI